MDHSVTRFADRAVIALSGRIDSTTAPELGHILNALFDQDVYQIILDMQAVDFVSSSGWWVLIAAQKCSRHVKQGEIVLVNLKCKIQESMGQVGIAPYFKVFEGVNSAMEYF